MRRTTLEESGDEIWPLAREAAGRLAAAPKHAKREAPFSYGEQCHPFVLETAYAVAISLFVLTGVASMIVHDVSQRNMDPLSHGGVVRNLSPNCSLVDGT